MIAAGVTLITAATHSLLTAGQEYAEAREEYGELRELFSETLAEKTTEQQPESAEGVLDIYDGEDEESPYTFEQLLAINPDFVGWLSIDGLISYPVVQRDDNSYYMHTTFTGESNPAGAIYMDCRHEQGFSSPVCIIYGHYSKDGFMFSPLHKYRDAAFMEDNPHIRIMTLDKVVLVYRVYAAEVTDAWDSVYDLDAPLDMSRVLVLSTCTGSDDKDERLLVYAALDEEVAS